MDAKHDNNGVATMLGTLDSDGVTPICIKVNPANSALKVVDGTTGFLVDSFSESNKDSFGNTYAGDSIGRGETFVANQNILLYSCKFYLSKIGTPTGNITAKLWSITGIMGTNAKPTGTALAISNAIDIATVNTNPTFNLFEFIFPVGQQPTLVSGNNYCITLLFNGGDSSNYLAVGRKNVSNAYPGRNRVYSTDEISWTGSNENATVFYVYGVSQLSNTAIKDHNGVPVLMGVSSADGTTLIPIAVDVNGNLLIKSS